MNLPVRHSLSSASVALLLGAIVSLAQTVQPPASKFTPQENDYVLRDFHCKSGETLPELRMHYLTLGKPARDAKRRVTNAVLILHGTGGSGRQFLAPQFADVLFGPGQLLDANRYFVILPDNIGHGKSSKPSDGLHAHFPQYDYDDMVLAQYDLLTQGLGVNHLRLIITANDKGKRPPRRARMIRIFNVGKARASTDGAGVTWNTRPVARDSPPSV
jgi:homoserine O-acetyltransferase/O-succinyltransferase